MRKAFVLVGLILCLILSAVGTARAEGAFNLSPAINFAGDTIFVFGETAFASGVGLQVGNAFDGLMEFKAQYVFSHKEGVADKAGFGVGLNIVEGLKRLGVEGIPEWLNVSCGLIGLVDVNKDAPKLGAGLYVNIIKIEL